MLVGLLSLSYFATFTRAENKAPKVLKSSKCADKFNPWFEVNKEKEAFEQLVEADSDNMEALKTALLKRAMTDVKRIWQLSEEKPSMSQLVKEGAISDEMWNSFKKAEQDLQLEVYDIQAEAEFIKPGWGESIVKEAAQLAAKERQLTMMVKEQKRKQKMEAREKKEKEKLQAKDKKEKEKEDQELIERSNRMAKELIEEEEREKAKTKNKK